jgi:glycosyltransferase involved in cell wall biosynthesis
LRKVFLSASETFCGEYSKFAALLFNYNGQRDWQKSERRMNTQRTVLIAPGHIPHYRNRFYELLTQNAAAAGIRLKIAAARAVPANILPGIVPGLIDAPMRKLGPLTWQNTLTPSAGCDLVIAQQEAKYVSNYLLQAKRLFSPQKFAFWGHGKNFQSKSSRTIAETIKRQTALRCDWWFAYNAASAAVVKELGFPEERITLVNNSIDTNALIAAHKALSPEAIESAKASLGIDSSNVAIYTGGLYEEKRIPFLLQAAAKVREQLPDFHLIIIGGGSLSKLVQNAADANSWIHYLGPMNDNEKIPYWAMAKVSLLPGLVGLGVLDSFALGVPLITTDYPYHSPEIEYLHNGVNGVIVRDWENIDAYARAVVDLLRDKDRLARMIDEGDRAARFYTIENMAANFASGIQKALQAPSF